MLRALTARQATTGRITAIVLRPRRGEPAIRVVEAVATPGRGLEGDRRALAADARAPGVAPSPTRELTLLQAEHLPLIARWTGHADVDACLLRRNLVVSGVNVMAMRSPFADQTLIWRIGDDVLIRVTGPCDPCSRMEDVLGPGGYNALRGHGGVTACLVQGGTIREDDVVRLESILPPAAPDRADDGKRGAHE